MPCVFFFCVFLRLRQDTRVCKFCFERFGVMFPYGILGARTLSWTNLRCIILFLQNPSTFLTYLVKAVHFSFPFLFSLFRLETFKVFLSSLLQFFFYLVPLYCRIGHGRAQDGATPRANASQDSVSGRGQFLIAYGGTPKW